MKKVLAGILAVVVVAALGWTHRDQFEGRTNCGDKIAHQYTTSQVVPGAYNCLNPVLKYQLAGFYGIQTDKEFAKALGVDGASYSYLGETKDGGFIYEIDIPIAKRSFGDELKATWSAVTSGDVQGAWDQLNLGTEIYQSFVITAYLYPSGSTYSDVNGTVDISGEILTIQ